MAVTKDQLVEMARTVLYSPASQANKATKDFAQACLAYFAADDEQTRGDLPAFLGGKDTQSSPYPGQGRAPSTRGLQGAELEELNRQMGVRPKNEPQFERLPTGELITRHIAPRDVAQRSARGDEGGIKIRRYP